MHNINKNKNINNSIEKKMISFAPFNINTLNRHLFKKNLIFRELLNAFMQNYPKI